MIWKEIEFRRFIWRRHFKNYAEGHNFCGAPLVRKCEDNPEGQSANDDKDEDHNGFIDEWFYLSVGLGFAVGILGPFFVLVLKRSWSEAYFSFVDEIVYNLGLERRRSWRRRRRRTHG